MYVKSGYKAMVHVLRNTTKPHYIPQKHLELLLPYLVCPMLALRLTPSLLSSTKLLSPFLSQVTKGVSLRGRHLIIIL